MLIILKQILIILAGICVVIAGICLLVSGVSFEHQKNQRFWRSATFGYQLLYLLLIIVVVGAVALGHRLWQRWYYETGPQPYASAEAAAADGCMVIQSPGTPLAGQEHWEAFLSDCQTFQEAAVRIAVYDGGGVRNVNELRYDGYRYHYTIHPPYIHQRSETETYPLLLHLFYAPAEEEAMLYSSRETWVLTDDPALTGEKLAQLTSDQKATLRARELIVITQWLF